MKNKKTIEIIKMNAYNDNVTGRVVLYKGEFFNIGPIKYTWIHKHAYRELRRLYYKNSIYINLFSNEKNNCWQYDYKKILLEKDMTFGVVIDL